MDDTCHEAQHAARSLKLHQRGPVCVEPVEDFWVDWEGGLEALLVVCVAALRRKLRALRAVEVGEGSRGHITLLERLGPCGWFEQPSPHDFEAFIGRSRCPGRFEPADHVA